VLFSYVRTKVQTNPWEVVYNETFETKSEAMKREYQIKAKKSR